MCTVYKTSTKNLIYPPLQKSHLISPKNATKKSIAKGKKPCCRELSSLQWITANKCCGQIGFFFFDATFLPWDAHLKAFDVKACVRNLEVVLHCFNKTNLGLIPQAIQQCFADTECICLTDLPAVQIHVLLKCTVHHNVKYLKMKTTDC